MASHLHDGDFLLSSSSSSSSGNDHDRKQTRIHLERARTTLQKVRPANPLHHLSMDVDEVKACRELGLDIPASASSPIHSWKISSPGDDPRDVKQRLRLWAHAVAVASAFKLGNE